MRTLIGVLVVSCLAMTSLVAFSADVLADDPDTQVTKGGSVVTGQTVEVAAAGEVNGASAVSDKSDTAHQESVSVSLGKSAESGAQKRLSGENTAAATDENSLALVWKELSPPYSASTPLPIDGQAMYYNPGVMQRVIDYRLQTARITHCAECVGYVAMLRAGDLNRKIWLQTGKATFEGPFLVTDVAATQHVGQLLAKNWAVDVDYRTARRWNMKMPYVTVWERPPLELFLARDTIPLIWSATTSPREHFVWPPRSIKTNWGVTANTRLLRSKPGTNFLRGGLVEERLDYYVR